MKTLLLASLMLFAGASYAADSAPSLKTSNYNQHTQVNQILTQVALAKVKPEHAVEFKRIVSGLLGQLRAQPGNISYEFAQSLEDPTEFVFTEKWISGASIKNHMESSLIQDFFGRVGNFFEAGYPQLIILK
ncbi:MAG TPA: antibiotic biosynthesis monooxygenase family protein [Bacteriovoracaceae bacterium]|nr:antibiotic biosynthesis monooxygenase family protein [Bacteriovoracaceae bacterium]